jgi:putative protease
MQIMAPVNDPSEVAPVLKSGAEEVYCGVMSDDWLKDFSNTVSPNRRQWRSANMENTGKLKEAVKIAHDLGARVNLALNEFYTGPQTPLILEQMERAVDAGIDALIVVDPGLLNEIGKRGKPCSIHIGTGGTSFNSETITFYRELGADRVILPRHVFPKDLEEIRKKVPMEGLEVFIMNAGCKNIDGMCTFQHGVNELMKGSRWHYMKKLNLDYSMQNLWRKLPEPLARSMARSPIHGHVDACFIAYDVSVSSDEWTAKQKKQAEAFVSSTFDLMSGIDVCGACSIYDFAAAGITLYKIVGRNFTTGRKVNDVRFIRGCLDFIENSSPPREEYREFAMARYREFYGLPCSMRCYYPE